MKPLRLFALIAIVLLVGWLALHLAQNREPRYQGRTLSEWLLEYSLNSASPSTAKDGPGKGDASVRAIKQIGTNAIPTLLKKLTAHNTALERRVKIWASSRSWMQYHFTSPQMEQILAFAGFKALEEDALSAIPALVKLCRHPDSGTQCFALLSLENVCDQDTLVRKLREMLQDPDYDTRVAAASLMILKAPEEATKAGVYQMFPQMRKPPVTNSVSTNAAEAKK